MCGIAGIWGDTDASLIHSMMETMTHRGPDASGTYEAPQQAGQLGHCRLAIMDPEGGDQPLRGTPPARAIIANGEFYNYPALRDRLAKAHPFQTNSDTEPALYLYDAMTTDAAGQLDGMFAFAIADGEDLYLARDPLGIKPLYYGQRADTLVFASELKALAGLARNVSAFPPGTWYHSTHGFHTYYRVPEQAPVDRPVGDWLRRVRRTLDRAVEKRLMSDVPVGAFLSGGLDSSLIAALMRRHVDTLHTFSVGLAGSRDLEAARRVAAYLGAVHHEYVFTADEILEKLPEIIYSLESFDQDLVRSAIPCYFTARLAAEHVKVILTGEGADELFAGYRYYKSIDDPAALHRELHRSVCGLHDINLQRVDRLTMAHSIEARVPFLDTELVDLALSIPPSLKLRPDASGQRVEKWILREACKDLLPADIIRRRKEQFDEGSGTAAVIAQVLQRWMPPAEARTYAARYPETRLRSPEETMYHKLLVAGYETPQAILDNVSRWTERPAVPAPERKGPPH